MIGYQGVESHKVGHQGVAESHKVYHKVADLRDPME